MQKTILITGATDGIGLETAKMLIKQGHHVLLHGRNASKLKALESTLSSLSDTASFESYLADLSSMQQVKALAQAIKKQHVNIDVLINNAGVYSSLHKKTIDGFDTRFAVNSIAPYLLTKLLLAELGDTGRVLNLSSAAQSSVDIDALSAQKLMSDGDAYSQSKLALTIWSRVLGQQLKAKGPAIIAINPKSLLGSKMVKDAFGIAGGDLSIGAEVLCQASLCDEFANASGLYFDNDLGKFADPHPDALDEKISQAVVVVLNRLIKIF